MDEASIALAILRLIELEKSVVEGAGATPLAAFLAGKLPELKGKRVVLVLCGGNIDLTMLDRVIEVGLVADGRLARFTVSITDRPGGLARLADVIASTGASIKEITHDRAFSGPDLSEVRVVCVVETTGRAHIDELHRALADRRGQGRRVITLDASTDRGSVRDAQALVDEAEQPHRPDEQRTDILEKRGLASFDDVAQELADPCQDKYDGADDQHMATEQCQRIAHQDHNAEHARRER